MSNTPLPAWVDTVKGVHAAEGSYSAATGKMIARSTLPVYQRQLFPELLLGEKSDPGSTVLDNEGVRMWTIKGYEDIAIVSFKSKMHSLGEEVLDGLNRAIDKAEAEYKGLVIWHEAPFAVGANLVKALAALQAGGVEAFESLVGKFQLASVRLKHGRVATMHAGGGLAAGRVCRL